MYAGRGRQPGKHRVQGAPVRSRLLDADAEDEYEIKDLVANDWWDDGAWEYSGQRKKKSIRSPNREGSASPPGTAGLES